MKITRIQRQARARFSGGRKFYKGLIWRGGVKIGTPLKRPNASIRRKLERDRREIRRNKT